MKTFKSEVEYNSLLVQERVEILYAALSDAQFDISCSGDVEVHFNPESGEWQKLRPVATIAHLTFGELPGSYRKAVWRILLDNVDGIAHVRPREQVFVRVGKVDPPVKLRHKPSGRMVLVTFRHGNDDRQHELHYVCNGESSFDLNWHFEKVFDS